MTGVSNESTPRARVARFLILLGRVRLFWPSTVAVLAVMLAVSLVVALHSVRTYRSETSVLFVEGIQTQSVLVESAAQRAARLGPKLKELLYARPELERVVAEFHLFPEKSERSMLDAVEAMQAAIGFRARAGDSFVLSFAYRDARTAQLVTTRLAEGVIEKYSRENIDAAAMTRDFLHRKRSESEAQVEAASRALAAFLAEHPQFQWGANDSPYAPAPATAGLAQSIARAAPPTLQPPAGPTAQALVALERELSRVEAELLAPRVSGQPSAKPGSPPPFATAAPTSILEAQRRRDAAAAELSAAQTALGEKLRTVTSVHPDAVEAERRVAAARESLALAERMLAISRAGGLTTDGASEKLTPVRRAELERLEASLRRQIAEHRTKRSEAPPPQANSASGPPGAPRIETPTTTNGSAAANRTVELETEWHRLRLDLERARSELHTLETTSHSADIASEAVSREGGGEIRVLEPAYLPLHPEHGRTRVFVLGCVAALFLAAGYGAARILLNDTLLDESDVTALGPIVVIGSLPHAPPPHVPPPSRSLVPASPLGTTHDADEPGAVGVSPTMSPAPGDPSQPPPRGWTRSPTMTAPDQSSTALVAPRAAPHLAKPLRDAWFDPEIEVIASDLFSDAPTSWIRVASEEWVSALRVLRHRLEQRRAGATLVVSVLSPRPREGRSMVAIWLAAALAEAQRARVALVEANFARPVIAATLGLKLAPELAFSYQLKRRMSGSSEAWGVLELGSSLSLLAESPLAASHAETIHSVHFDLAISSLRRAFDYVLLDGPCVVGAGEANVVEAVSDAVLLVARAGVTRGSFLVRAIQQLNTHKVLGVVLNDVAGPNGTGDRVGDVATFGEE